MTRAVADEIARARAVRPRSRAFAPVSPRHVALRLVARRSVMPRLSARHWAAQMDAPNRPLITLRHPNEHPPSRSTSESARHRTSRGAAPLGGERTRRCHGADRIPARLTAHRGASARPHAIRGVAARARGGARPAEWRYRPFLGSRESPLTFVLTAAELESSAAAQVVFAHAASTNAGESHRNASCRWSAQRRSTGRVLSWL